MLLTRTRRWPSRGVGVDRRVVVRCLAVAVTMTVIVTVIVVMTMTVVAVVRAVVGQGHGGGDGQNLKENGGETVTFFFQNGISIRAPPFWKLQDYCWAVSSIHGNWESFLRQFLYREVGLVNVFLKVAAGEFTGLYEL